jgi:uncharacterized protein (DUF58 family)
MRPVPTTRALALFALALLPTLLSAWLPPLVLLAIALDVVTLLLVAADFFLAPRASDLRVRREVEPVISTGHRVTVRLELERVARTRNPIRGELRDFVPPGVDAANTRQRFSLEVRAALEWTLVARTRGDLTLGDVWLRLLGPLGLCARQVRVPLRQTIKVFPDLLALSTDALALARAQDDASRRVVRLRSDGREFESLRDYRDGDDRRSIDWKATARRSKTIVRVHQPERNQQVLVLLDCGRHMAGEVLGRRKLDHVVDATLRLAKVSLDQGDLVGVLAFGATVKASLPPRRGGDQLRAIVQALYRVEATLEESDYGAALDLAFARASRRTLVVIMTDLLDPDSSAALLRRTRKLVPRHLPLVASLLDEEVHRLALQVPATAEQAHARFVASGLEREAASTVTRLREGGARVLRETPGRFGAASVSAYLDIKNRGLL